VNPRPPSPKPGRRGQLPAAETTFINVRGGRLEALDLAGDPNEPALVLLHEGLGSVGLWRSFPQDLHRATGLRTVAFSRFGHGRSDAPPRPRAPLFMHEEARDVLPAVLGELDVRRPILVGHSDGGSIALIYASEHEVTGLVLLAPHVFVEDKCVTAIAEIDARFDDTLRERMARHHDDPAVTFRGWADVWLDPEFRSWNLEPLLPAITAPTLLIQGRDDEYGTLAQIDTIAAASSGFTQKLVLPGGHSPHLEHPEDMVRAVERFVHWVLGGHGRELDVTAS
jgi:pimeloyl-ACP methyl ester carboxylesterase